LSLYSGYICGYKTTIKSVNSKIEICVEKELLPGDGSLLKEGESREFED